MSVQDSCFIEFKTDVSGITVPDRFTYPFYYTPHQLCVIAAQELQELITVLEHDWQHDFWSDTHGVGKMFGVLVVKNKGRLGYLAAFSGQLNGSMDIAPFVSGAYNDEYSKSYQDAQFARFNELSQQAQQLKDNPTYKTAVEQLHSLQAENKHLLTLQRAKHKKQSAARKKERLAQQKQLSPTLFKELQEHHKQQRLNEKFLLKEYAVYLEQKEQSLDHTVSSFEQQIEVMTQRRQQESLELQYWIFKKYELLNAHGEKKDILTIFNEFNLGIPPSSTGDCAAPKLLQHAYKNDLKPIALAEFWWGKASKSQIRKHLQFYPSCRSKCEPILSHMLQGLDVEENPLLKNPATNKSIAIIYEDEALVIIHKPAEFLSVPGKNITDSVLTRLQDKYPKATGPLLVHRLDMSTSGILVAAKTKQAHQYIQEQFINRSISKRYVALLDGKIKNKTGFVELPLRVDLDNRPAQLVCYEHGKSARTKYELIEQRDQQALVHFYPITGRTHQLRVHAAHIDGLNAPIVGDDLYGKVSTRLYLHAEYIKLKHPVTGKTISFTVKADF